MFQLISLVVFVIIFDSLLVIISADCSISSGTCPNGIILDYPFSSYGANVNYTIDDCGYSGFEINCSSNQEAGIATMIISNQTFDVQNINYGKKVLRVVDMDVYGQKCPRPKRNVSLQSTPWLSYSNFHGAEKWYIFYKCRSQHPLESNYSNFQPIPCLNNSTDDKYSYAFQVSVPGIDDFYDPSWFEANCQETVETRTLSTYNYTEAAEFGFDLRWSVPIECKKCEQSGGNCYYNKTAEAHQCDCYHDGPTSYDPLTCRPKSLSGWQKVLYGVSVAVGGLLLSLFLLHIRIFNLLYHLNFARWQTRTKGLKNVEVLLESYGCLALKKYKYSDIMAMTKSFKYKLGQGGYGCVFKGTLRNDGRLVAVKVLNESKGNGEDFINEVATIGRTNHVNVVSLLGFCIEGNKRALVYEFMPNGSLERFIYNEKTSTTQSTHLGWEKLYQIAIGIAKGLEYLHCGCNTRILHFDIKPHNILLDKDFFPKISDFGLAKLCPTKESIVSMVGARGTIGYIAPEISCRNLGLGGVSHKSDVYSYGMMVLEMIGGRKNLDVTVENMSGIYFPHWIYNQLNRDSKTVESEIIKFDGVGEILKDAIARKMIIVALWCIQTHPTNRPSMTKVVEMLEGSDEELQMPPNPSLDHVSLSSSSST